MKMLMYGLAMSLGFLANNAMADQVVNVDGEDYFLSDLTANCQSIAGDPAAQIACYTALSQLLAEQAVETPDNSEAITAALTVLRATAQYQDEDSGLLITGSDCNIQILYFNNYFHISRRNISSIDLFGVQFDASKMQNAQTVAVQGAQALLRMGTMEAGSTAAMRGGIALESSQHNFAPRSPGSAIDAYASEVAPQLPAREAQEFNFVLIHPQLSQASAEIQSAFETFVNTCKG